MTDEIFVADTALIFEGGAMRNAYTAAAVTALVDAGIVFPKVYGISAGAALAAFYATRNPERARATFTDAVKVKGAGGLGSLLEGHGFFDLQRIFEGLAEIHAAADDQWSVNFDQLKTGPTDLHIEAFDIESGTTQAWERSSMATLTDLMVRIQASCAYPLFTTAVQVEGRSYVDGGMGTSHGICLEAARADGFERFFVVRTQPHPYRMKPIATAKMDAYRVAYGKYPAVLGTLRNRPRLYNRLLDELDVLAAQGRAYLFCPRTMPITYKTTDYRRLCDAYELGLNQCRAELPQWLEWLQHG